MNEAHQHGRQAEFFVRNVLQKQNWQVHASNYRSRHFEIDIIAQKGKTLAAVEVKFRTWANPDLESVTKLLPYHRRRRLALGLRHFVHNHPELDYESLRLDLALVLAKSVRSDYALYYYPDVSG